MEKGKRDQDTVFECSSEHDTDCNGQDQSKPIAPILASAVSIGACFAIFFGSQKLIAKAKPEMLQMHKNALTIGAGFAAAILCVGIYALYVHFASQDKSLEVGDAQDGLSDALKDDDIRVLPSTGSRASSAFSVESGKSSLLT